MPTSANVSLPLVPPPTNRPIHASSPPHADRTPRKEDALSKPRTSSSDWIDIDEDKPRRRRKVKRSGSTVESPRRGTRSSEKKSSDLGRFFPKLSQILESNEAKTPSRARQTTLRSYTSPKETSRRRSSSLQKQDSLLSLNASLLSVITDLTAATSKSSGSNSTITQRSYRQRPESAHRRAHRGYRRAMSDASSIMSSSSRARVSYEYSDIADDRSILSSSTSSQHRSEAGSSDAPETPSSSSTYPSPATSERRHGKQIVPLESSVLSSVTGSEMSVGTEGTYESSIIDGPQFFFREGDPPAYDVQQPLPAPMPAHPSAFSAQHFEEMHRSHSHSSSEQQQALQHYYTRPHIEDEPEQALQEEHYDVPGVPTAPDAPNLSQVTVAGYEKLARELLKGDQVKPLYRKFEYLNHRILLHLQDELAELEEQLRRDDEIIAQMEPTDQGKIIPASRRGDAYYGHEIHHHRTALLGRIFIKTEQYYKAMSAYASMTRDRRPAHEGDVSQYRDWMSKETPIHELEADFLQRPKDLVAPGGQVTQQAMPLAVIGLASLAAALPMLVIAVVPTVVGRLLSTLVIAAVIIGLRTTTAILHTLSIWDTTVCTLAFVLIMSTMAVCVPQAV